MSDDGEEGWASKSVMREGSGMVAGAPLSLSGVEGRLAMFEPDAFRFGDADDEEADAEPEEDGAAAAAAAAAVVERDNGDGEPPRTRDVEAEIDFLNLDRLESALGEGEGD